jgi:hypothetical protein
MACIHYPVAWGIPFVSSALIPPDIVKSDCLIQTCLDAILRIWEKLRWCTQGPEPLGYWKVRTTGKSGDTAHVTQGPDSLAELEGATHRMEY